MEVIEGASLAGTIWANKDLIKIIYEDVAQPSTRSVGKALGLVFDFSMNYLQYLGERQKVLLGKRIEEYRSKICNIPEEKIIEVPPEIGVPVLQRLTYTTNDELANLFLELLKTASSTDTIQLAQPRFIQIIEALSVDEARIIHYLRKQEYFPYFYLRAKNWVVLKHEEYNFTSNITGIEKRIDLMFPDNMQAYLDNFIGLSLIHNESPLQLSKRQIYTELLSLYNVGAMINDHKKIKPEAVISRKMSYYLITDFGLSFIKCCCPNTSD